VKKIGFEVLFNKTIKNKTKNQEYIIYNQEQLLKTDISDLFKEITIDFKTDIIVVLSLQHEGILNFLSVEDVSITNSNGTTSESKNISINIDIKYRKLTSKKYTIGAIKLKKPQKNIQISYLSEKMGIQQVYFFQSGSNEGNFLFSILSSEDDLKSLNLKLDYPLDWHKKQLILFQMKRNNKYYQNVMLDNVYRLWDGKNWKLEVTIITSEKLKIEKNSEILPNYFLFEVNKFEFDEITYKNRLISNYEGKIKFKEEFYFEIDSDEDLSKKTSSFSSQICYNINQIFEVLNIFNCQKNTSFEEINFSEKHVIITKNKKIKNFYSDYIKGNVLCNHTIELENINIDTNKIHLIAYSFEFVDKYTLGIVS
jgi:hypothetical protein